MMITIAMPELRGRNGHSVSGGGVFTRSVSAAHPLKVEPLTGSVGLPALDKYPIQWAWKSCQKIAVPEREEGIGRLRKPCP
jgi:hypothetical protein